MSRISPKLTFAVKVLMERRQDLNIVKHKAHQIMRRRPVVGCVDAFDLAKLLAAWCSVLGGNPCGTCGP